MNGPGIEELLEQLYMQQVEGRTAAGAPQPELLKQAQEEKYLDLTGGLPRLTETGLQMGRDVVRRHRLAELLLRDVLQVSGEPQVEDAACEFEHILRHGLDDQICALLGHPTACPHGSPIPEGACCRKARADQIREVGPLCDGEVDRQGIVAYLNTRDDRETQKLMAMGVLPGIDIRLTRRFPSYVFEVGYSQFSVDKRLAEKIFVHWSPRAKHAGGHAG